MRRPVLYILSILSAFLCSQVTYAAPKKHFKGDKFVSWGTGTRVDLKESKEFIKPQTSLLINPDFGIYASNDMFLTFGLDYAQTFGKHSTSTLQLIATASAAIAVGNKLNYTPGFGMSTGGMATAGHTFFTFTTFLDCASFEYSFNSNWALVFNCMRFQYAMTDVKDYGDTSGTGIDLNFSLSATIGFRYFLN